MVMRSAIYFLSHIMKQFQNEFPQVVRNIKYIYGNIRIDTFKRRRKSYFLAGGNIAPYLTHIHTSPVCKSIYFVEQKEDPLATLDIVTPKDLEGQRLMIGGGRGNSFRFSRYLQQC